MIGFVYARCPWCGGKQLIPIGEDEARCLACDKQRTSVCHAAAAANEPRANVPPAAKPDCSVPDCRKAKVGTPSEREAIAAAFPTRSGRHDLYAEAMRFVGERHAKSDLVELVNWLLVSSNETVGALAKDLAEARGENARLRTTLAFYADPETYSNLHPSHPGKTFSRRITYDTADDKGGALWAAGERARRALAAQGASK